MKKLIGILSGVLMMFDSFAQVEYSELSLNTITTQISRMSEVKAIQIT